MGILLLGQRLVEPPIGIGRDRARSEASRELAQPIYHQHDPNLIQRLSNSFWDRIGELLSHAGGVRGLPLISLLFMLAVLAVIVGLLIWRYGVPAGSASAPTGDVFAAGQTLTSREHAALAVTAARQGRWTEAVQERFRALVRGLEERDLVPSGAGQTAVEAMASARAAMPTLARGFTDAAGRFDDATYGGRDGDEATYQRLTELEAKARTTRPTASGEGDRHEFALPR